MDQVIEKIYEHILEDKADICKWGNVIGWDYNFDLEWWANAWNKEYRTYYIQDEELYWSRDSSGSIHEWNDYEYTRFDMDGKIVGGNER